MEENKTAPLDEWEDVDLCDVTEAAKAAETAADQPAEPETPEAEAAEETPEDAKAEEEKVQAVETPETFELKHLDEVRRVGREEVVALAQKGMDYDRIRKKYEALGDIQQKYTELETATTYLRELAKAQDIPLADLVERSQAAALAQKEGIPLETAQARVGFARRERELAAREERLQAQRNLAAQTQAAEKRRTDIQKFVKAYPRVDPGEIPKTVWAAVRAGEGLTEAYAKHEAERLKLQLSMEQKNRENREKSLGSLSTEGRDLKKDPLDQYWYGDDD